MFITTTHAYWYKDDKSLREIALVLLHESDPKSQELNSHMKNLQKRNLWCMGPNFSIQGSIIEYNDEQGEALYLLKCKLSDMPFDTIDTSRILVMDYENDPEGHVVAAVQPIQQKKTQPLVMCSELVINEGKYLLEWIDYHRLMGISLFAIYDMGSNDNTKQILKPYMNAGVVDLIQWNVTNLMSAQNDCLYRYKQDTKWQLYVDTNEFMWYNGTKSVIELLESDPGKSQGFEIMSFAMGGRKMNSELMIGQYNMYDE
jgi:hypothetical protein